MGYRSDIGLCLSFEAQQVLAQAQEASPHKTVIEKFIEQAQVTTHDDTGTVVFHWEWTKWYSHFSNVAFFEELLSTLDHEEYLFIRIGETDDDIEHHGGYWENPLNMTLRREICFE